MAASYQLEDVRKIGKVGGYSYCVTIPKAIIQALGWQNGQRVVLGLKDDSIVIRTGALRRRSGADKRRCERHR